MTQKIHRNNRLIDGNPWLFDGSPCNDTRRCDTISRASEPAPHTSKHISTKKRKSVCPTCEYFEKCLEEVIESLDRWLARYVEPLRKKSVEV